MRYTTKSITAGSVGRETVAAAAQRNPYSFGAVKRSIDRHKHGTHAGLEHITIQVLDGSTVIGEIDVHLHHNRRGFSLGTTTRVFHSAARFTTRG